MNRVPKSVAITLVSIVLAIPGISAFAQTSRFAYVADFGPAIEGYTVNPATGQLRHVGSTPVAGGFIPEGLALHPTGRFLYLSDFTATHVVVAYVVNQATGSLTAVPGSPFSTGGNGFGCACSSDLVFTPDGRFLYASDDASNLVAAFSVNPTTGVLTTVPGSPFPAGNSPEGLVINSGGEFLFEADQGTAIATSTISVYRINSSSGAITPVAGSPFPDQSLYTVSLELTPSGNFLYVGHNVTNGGISAFAVNTTTGSLTSVPGSPFAIGEVAFFWGFVIDATGHFLYSLDDNNSRVELFTINSKTGALTEVAGSLLPTKQFANSITMDSAGKFIYVSNGPSTSLSLFSVDHTTGKLSVLESVDSGAAGVFIKLANGPRAVSYIPKFAYVANQGSGSLSEYAIDSTTGAQTVVGSKSDNHPVALTAAPEGKFVYAANGNSTISGYKMNPSTGVLNSVAGSPFGGVNQPVAAVSYAAQGFEMLATANAGDNTVALFTIDQTTGALSLTPTKVPSGVGPHGVAATPAGTYLFVVNSRDNTVWAYNGLTGAAILNPKTGNPGFPTGKTPVGVAVDPAGQFLYVVNRSSNNVSGYRISSNGFVHPGVPSPVRGSPFAAGTSPVAVLVDPLGRYLYVANSDGISAYAIDASTGVLTSIAGSPFGTGVDALGVSNDGKFLYATSKVAGTASIFSINADGTLTAAGCAPTGTQPVSIIATGTSK